jgi:hypothetical protein
MRTTLTLDDDVFQTAVRLAEARRRSLGKTVSDLIRKGLKIPAQTRSHSGLVVFALPSDSPAVTAETVKRLENDPR